MKFHFSFNYKPDPSGSRSPYPKAGVMLLAMYLFLVLFILFGLRLPKQAGASVPIIMLSLVLPPFGLIFLLKGMIPVWRGNRIKADGERIMARILRVERGRSGFNGVYPYRLVLAAPNGKDEIRSEWLYLREYLPESAVGGLYPVYVCQKGDHTRYFVEPFAFRDGDWTPPASD